MLKTNQDMARCVRAPQGEIRSLFSLLSYMVFLWGVKLLSHHWRVPDKITMDKVKDSLTGHGKAGCRYCKKFCWRYSGKAQVEE